ncbi:proteasome accessory factor PafA2 family protein [Candidatus Saccharibacteria bacterium]|nr:proteasome accessory factor PafA2 family protein [Candidatus Saccharibacteria bacterium]
MYTRRIYAVEEEMRLANFNDFNILHAGTQRHGAHLAKNYFGAMGLFSVNGFLFDPDNPDEILPKVSDDKGSLEASTPEMSTASAAVQSLVDSRHILTDLFALQEHYNLFLHQSTMTTYPSGTHLNLSTEADLPSYARPMALHQLSMPVLFGSGYYSRRDIQRGVDEGFCISPKMMTLDKVQGSSDGDNGAEGVLFDTRRISSDFKNMHITSTDTNRVDYMTWLKLVSSSLVMRLVEQTHGTAIDDGHLNLIDLDNNMLFEPYRQTHKLKNDDGRFADISVLRTPAIEIQRGLIESCKKLDDVTHEEEVGLRHWEELVRRSEEGDFEGTEWKARLDIVRETDDPWGVNLEVSDARVSRVADLWSVRNPNLAIPKIVGPPTRSLGRLALLRAAFEGHVKIAELGWEYDDRRTGKRRTRRTSHQDVHDPTPWI